MRRKGQHRDPETVRDLFEDALTETFPDHSFDVAYDEMKANPDASFDEGSVGSFRVEAEFPDGNKREITSPPKDIDNEFSLSEMIEDVGVTLELAQHYDQETELDPNTDPEIEPDPDL